jgi:hypothetical protein
VANNPPPIHPVIHALADLKATLKASLYFNDAQKMLRAANSFNALNAAAHLLDCPEFEALPKEARDDLDAQFRAKVISITCGGVL